MKYLVFINVCETVCFLPKPYASASVPRVSLALPGALLDGIRGPPHREWCTQEARAVQLEGLRSAFVWGLVWVGVGVGVFGFIRSQRHTILSPAACHEH